MSFNYAALEQSSALLLERFGRQLTFTRTTVGSYNPNTGSSSNTTSTFNKYCCVFDYSDEDRAETTIEVGDRRLLAESGTYLVGDTVSIENEIYRVVGVSNIQPAGTVVACNIQVRK